MHTRGTLRSSDEYEVVHTRATRVPNDVVASLATARGMDVSSVFAVLLDSGGVAVETLTRGEALLLHALRTPDWDVELFLALVGPRYPATLARLLALGALVPDHSQHCGVNTPLSHPLMELAQQAVRFGYHHITLGGEALARRLYAYNTVPIYGNSVTRLVHANELLQWLAGSSRHAREFVSSATQLDQDWIRFSSHSRGRLRHKVYVSQIVHELPLAFQAVCAELARWPTLDFGLKVAATPRYLGRPDKLVVHLSCLEDVRRVGDVLAPALCTLRPHGVPFTAPLCATEVLSWGWDPPHQDGLMQSWRQWLTSELAALITALRGRALATGDMWPRLASALELLEIDPNTWGSMKAYAS